MWQKSIGGSGEDGLFQTIALPEQSIVLGGHTASSISDNITVPGYGDIDYWLVKLAPENLSTSDNPLNPYSFYPNPTTESVTLRFETLQEEITITVYNQLSQKTQEMHFTNSESIPFSLNGDPGVYFVKIKTGHDTESSIKVIKK
ncbi:MAG TPA: T9SS type A sorting domain-containing protein [Flavobacterium sp.]|uniref:T9SS type A sorting domain-containing protein n=1 Tax=Flavobacterium sp. TaxID=239 RepID=UPI002CE99F3D|nr:T9SS type A sorting domain-containing protein [Flavobacterium sp.]HSD14737.1 T9SS type A sorting domain-containing protein [Flavobacterium sp.]